MCTLLFLFLPVNSFSDPCLRKMLVAGEYRRKLFSFSFLKFYISSVAFPQHQSCMQPAYFKPFCVLCFVCLVPGIYVYVFNIMYNILHISTDNKLHLGVLPFHLFNNL